MEHDVTSRMTTLPVFDCVSLIRSIRKFYEFQSPTSEHEISNTDDGMRERSDKTDAFLVKYQDRTYDIRDFLKRHPGGQKVLCGFRNRNLGKALDENRHAKSAYHLLEEFLLKEGNERDENKLEKLIDWNAAMFWQVGGLGERYAEWMNLPVNRSIRLFESDFCEKLTITPWYVVPLVWIPACLYFLYMGFTGLNFNFSGSTLFKILVSYGVGVLMWTLLEYVLHRKIFHFRPPANSKVLISLHFLLHGVHHKAPFDGQRLLFPPVAGIIVAWLLWNLYGMLFPLSMVPFIAAGTTTGYLCYDMMHYYLHHGSPAANTYLYNMKRSHNYHHFSHHDQGFGISSTVWDRAFGTGITLRNLAKPIEW